MIVDEDYVINKKEYTIDFKEGYSEAVRNLAVLIKRITAIDVKQQNSKT